MTKKTKNKYKHYTEDFRRGAVRRSEEDGVSAVNVAREHRRDDMNVIPPNASKPLKAGNVLVLFGTPEALEHAEVYLLNG